MQKTQLLLQKIAVFGSIVLASLMIVFALGFSTDFHALRQHRNPGETMFYVSGAEMYEEVQPFNRLLLNHTVGLFFLCVTMIVTLTHRRRLYYFSNYITSLAFAGYAVYLAQMVFSHVLKFKEMYLLVDFERMQTVRNMLRMSFSQSTFMMDAGIVLSVLLIVFAGLLFVNLVLKTVWMKQEKWLDTAEARA